MTAVMSAVNRKARARETRSRIAAAAASLFAARGYQGTPMDEIAAEAGVAVQTVYFAFRTKPELLVAAYDQAVLGSLDGPTPDRQEWHQKVLADAAATPTQALRRFVEGVMGILGRSAALVPVMTTSPNEDVRRAFELRQQGRYDAYRQVIQALLRHGHLHPALDETTATDRLYAVLSRAARRPVRRAWLRTPEAFAGWALTTLEGQLLRRRGARTRLAASPASTRTFRSLTSPRPVTSTPTTSG